MMVVALFLLKALLFLVAESFLTWYAADRMKIRFPLGALPPFVVIYSILFLIPYAGWIIATVFLFRFTSVMTNAKTWPESTAYALVIVPLTWLLKVLLF